MVSQDNERGRRNSGGTEMASDTSGSKTPEGDAAAETGASAEEPVSENEPDPAHVPLFIRRLRSSKHAAHSLTDPPAAQAPVVGAGAPQPEGSAQTSTGRARPRQRRGRFPTLAFVFLAGAVTAIGGAYLLEVSEGTDMRHLQAPPLPSVTVSIRWPEVQTHSGGKGDESSGADAAVENPPQTTTPAGPDRLEQAQTTAGAQDEPAPDIAAQGSSMARPEPSQASLNKDLSSGQVALFAFIRGDQETALGDIAAARRFYEKAAEGGVTGAATAVGRTYDPIYLKAAGVRGFLADPDKARQWYEKASSLGDAEARTRLNLLAQSGRR